jgi:hypothetical protein
MVSEVLRSQQLVSLLQQELEKPPVLNVVAPVLEQSALILIIDDDRLLIEQITQSPTLTLLSALVMIL